MADDTAGRNKSDIILDEIMRRKKQEAIVDVEEKTVKMVVFSLQGDFYAFYGECIKEILPLMTVYFVPGAPDFIPGVINVRGEIESVISINRFLGLADSANPHSGRIALAMSGAVRSGILVDSIEDVLDIPVSSIRPPLGTLSNTIREFLAGEFVLGDRLVTVLDVGKIFGKFSG